MYSFHYKGFSVWYNGIQGFWIIQQGYTIIKSGYLSSGAAKSAITQKYSKEV